MTLKINLKSFVSSLTLVVGLCALSGAASAEQIQEYPSEKDWTISAGAVSIYGPAFEGSDDYTLSAMPDVRIKYKEDFFASIPEGIGYNVITRARGEDGWKVGPIAKVNFGRDEDGEGTFTISGDTDALRGMGDVDTTFELGGFADYQWNVLQSRLELRQGVGGHEGVVADAQVNYSDSLGPIRFGAGPRLKWASADYNQTYFGVDAAQSARTGLARYEADAGIVSYGVGASGMMPVTDSISMVAFAGYDRLGDQAKDSSFIEERGDENQMSIGLGVSYRFGFAH